MRSNLAEEPEAPRLLTVFTTPMTERHRSVGACEGVFELACQQVRLSDLHSAGTLKVADPGGLVILQRFV
jgi:hypothetical protein